MSRSPDPSEKQERPAAPMLTGGTLDRTPLVDLFLNLYRDRESVQLLVSRMGEERTFWFDRGQLLSAASNREAQLVGDLLRTFGLADETVLFNAFEKALTDPGRGLARALKDSGVAPYVADACVRALAERILFDTFRFTSGAFTVTALDRDPADFPVRFELSNGTLVLEALRRLPPDTPVPGVRVEPVARPVLSPDLLTRYQLLTLLPEEAEVLSRVDGRLAAADVCSDLSILERLKAVGVLHFLPVQQVAQPDAPGSAAILNVEIAGAPLPTRQAEAIEKQKTTVWNTWRRIDWITLYDVLGVPRDASDEDVQRAIHERARLFHPDNVLRPALADARDALEVLFKRVKQAQKVFRTAESRKSYDAAQGGDAQQVAVEQAGGAVEIQLEMAKKNYKRARELYEMEDYYPAYEMIRQSIEFDPERAEYWILLSRVQRKNPRWLRQASETLRRAALKLGDSADIWFELSECLALERNEPERVKALKEVLRIDPANRRAQAALAEIAALKPGR